MEITMSDGLDIKGIDKAELLAGLYNRSKPLGLGFLQATPSDMTAEQARGIIKEQGLDFDYLNGGVMNVNLARGTLYAGGFDRDNGKGAAQSVVEAIRTGQAAPKNTESLAGGLEKVIAGAKPTTSTQAGHVTVFSVGINPELVRALEARR